MFGKMGVVWLGLMFVFVSADMAASSCDGAPVAQEDILKNELEEEDCITHERLHIIVLGASGDLAKKKTFPTLFSLFKNNYLPHSVRMVGYARSGLTSQALREKIRPYLKVAPGEERIVETFLDNLHYVRGTYDKPEGFVKLDERVKELAAESSTHVTANNRMFYLALPPSVFVPVATEIKNHAMATDGWTRVIVEKPFGKDSESSEELSIHLKALFSEDQLYRIDHYLGKEVVQNVLALRFANRIFQRSWNRDVISSVTITQKEPFGTGGRGGYFDDFGIIRDIMQNHLIQIFSLIAMDQPNSLSAEDIRDMKVQVLKATETAKLDDVVLGQYVASTSPNATGEALEGYLDDKTVPAGSKTATYAQAVLHVRNSRWDGVPFILNCGKALDERIVEVRVQFHETPGVLFPEAGRDELVLRVQPNEAIYMKFAMKKPGLAFHTTKTELDLNYNSRFEGTRLPEAYERLILDVLIGAQHNFVRTDELAEAWRIFTPVLNEIEEKQITPIPYEHGSRGIPEAEEMAKKYGYEKDTTYVHRSNL